MKGSKQEQAAEGGTGAREVRAGSEAEAGVAAIAKAGVIETAEVEAEAEWVETVTEEETVAEAVADKETEAGGRQEQVETDNRYGSNRLMKSQPISCHLTRGGA